MYIWPNKIAIKTIYNQSNNINQININSNNEKFKGMLMLSKGWNLLRPWDRYGVSEKSCSHPFQNFMETEVFYS